MHLKGKSQIRTVSLKSFCHAYYFVSYVLPRIISQLEECYYGRQFTIITETETTLKKLARQYKFKYTVPAQP